MVGGFGGGRAVLREGEREMLGAGPQRAWCSVFDLERDERFWNFLPGIREFGEFFLGPDSIESFALQIEGSEAPEAILLPSLPSSHLPPASCYPQCGAGDLSRRSEGEENCLSLPH